MFDGPFSESLIARAQKNDIVEINVHNLRNWTEDKHQQVDDKPFGGGAGMVLQVEPMYKALKELRTDDSNVYLMSPQGKKFSQQMAAHMTKESHMILICGHYEGFDERIREHLIDGEISIGDFVMTGGELPAMVVTETIIRLLPGVVGKDESIKSDSFQRPILDYPEYTQPAEFVTDEGESWSVPDVLRSGNHAEIGKWREEQSLKRTQERRPDLLE